MERDGDGVLHVVALSGGKDSTAMGLRLIQVEQGPFIFVCTPTGSELPVMFEHWRMLREAVKPHPFIPLVATTLDKLIDEWDALPNWRMRWCTRVLKIEPFKHFLLANRPVVAYVGLRADEETRQGAVYGDIEGVTQRYPLREWGWGLKDVHRYLERRGVSIPHRTDCGQCFFQTLGEWWNVWRENPDLWRHYEEQEKRTGHTYRSEQRDTWPAALSGLRQEFERGRLPRDANVQCDLFDDVKRRERRCRICSL
jgi:3'-phosphoadenosine 5'-phosphosulfate sulfotransferase (PAPS reductase)/FAD synthetase